LSENGASPGESPSLVDALKALANGDLSHTRVARLSDLSKGDLAEVAAFWPTIPEATRAELVRQFETLAEERIDVNFRRVLDLALNDASPVVRQLAIAALWEDDSTRMRDRLLELLAHDASPDVRAEAARALERHAERVAVDDPDPHAASGILTALLTAYEGDHSYVVQRRALESMGSFCAQDRVATTIREAFASDDQGIHCSAIYAMGRSQQDRWLPEILRDLASDEPEVRFEAARAAGALGSADALPLLVEAGQDDDAEVRHAAIAAIGRVGGRGARRALERLTEGAGEADLELIESTLDDVNEMIDPFTSS
jgi:HEAT repeat protein